MTSRGIVEIDEDADALAGFRGEDRLEQPGEAERRKRGYGLSGLFAWYSLGLMLSVE